jgi:uncharacterized protein YjiS (DUF1127 family)
MISPSIWAEAHERNMEMAYVSAEKVSNVKIGERIGSYALGFGKRIGDYRLYMRTLRELQAMSERDLADLGLTSFQLKDVARDAVYGASK